MCTAVADPDVQPGVREQDQEAVEAAGQERSAYIKQLRLRHTDKVQGRTTFSFHYLFLRHFYEFIFPLFLN